MTNDWICNGCKRTIHTNDHWGIFDGIIWHLLCRKEDSESVHNAKEDSNDTQT